MPEIPIGRLAPSPTGALHLGNARSFLLAWLSIRSQQGKLILRIEDIDSPRVKPWAAATTVEDLRWLKLDWDLGPGAVGGGDTLDGSHFVQSNRLARYREVLQHLLDDDRIYRCFCTRKEVAEAASAPHENRLRALEGPVYPGTCRPPSSQPARMLATDDAFAWRMKIDPAPMTWQDRVLGPVAANPSKQLGDFVIARGDWRPAYQLAVVVDDHDMGVTEVVRGDDLTYSTFRQLAVLQALGWRAPQYMHVPLIVGPDGRRLAKRHGDTRLAHFRERGILPQAVIGYLAWTLRLIPEPAPMAPTDLIAMLDWTALPVQPTVFEPASDWPLLSRLSR